MFFTANDYVEQGKALYFEGRYDNAIASHDKAIQIESDNPRAWFGRGTALAKLQQDQDAIASYGQVIQIKPDFYLAWFGKARCYALPGDIELTIENLQQEINLNADKCRETAKTDSSFDKVREEERFKQLIWEDTEVG